MPLKRCGENGKGWKWGDSGKCYTGKDAKKNAIKQGLAISPEEFKQKASTIAEIDSIIEAAYELGWPIEQIREWNV